MMMIISTDADDHGTPEREYDFYLEIITSVVITCDSKIILMMNDSALIFQCFKPSEKYIVFNFQIFQTREATS